MKVNGEIITKVRPEFQSTKSLPSLDSSVFTWVVHRNADLLSTKDTAIAYEIDNDKLDVSHVRLRNTGQRSGIAHRKKKPPRHSMGALRNHKTARVCKRRSFLCLAMNKYAADGEATNREYQRGEMRVFRRRPLRRFDKLVSVLLRPILQVRPSHNMRMHCSQ